MFRLFILYEYITFLKLEFVSYFSSLSQYGSIWSNLCNEYKWHKRQNKKKEKREINKEFLGVKISKLNKLKVLLLT